MTANEIKATASIVRNTYADERVYFKSIDFMEPIKASFIPYLEAERTQSQLPTPPNRCANVIYLLGKKFTLYKCVVDLTLGKIVKTDVFPNHFPPVDVDEMNLIEEIVLAHPEVQKEIDILDLPAGYKVFVDPWMYGTDTAGEDRQLWQCYMYISNKPDHAENNFYSLPLDWSPVFTTRTHELVRIDRLPTGKDETIRTEGRKWSRVEPVEYAHDLIASDLRNDLKPLHITQPNGPSFELHGTKMNWQKWSFRVSFNAREGPVLHSVRYDGRDVFYRLSLSEMTVPYGDPRAPFHRKQAFDLGDVGFGTSANRLDLGCDCLGHIQYLDGYLVDHKGEPILCKNVVCVHEQDNGILWKHTNYRTNVASVVRNRELVLQTVCTVANYEYIIAYIFDQAGGIHFETRATGILATMPMDDGVSVPWGTKVGPGVMAAYHQHLFCLRVDPAIDGHRNTATYEDSMPLPIDEKLNPYGIGYTAHETRMQKESYADSDPTKARVFKIQNPNVLNPLTQKPVAYKVHLPATQMLIANPKSFNSTRAEFARHAVHVTKYHDGELFPAGEFTNQSQGKNTDSIENWMARGESTENEDIVCWYTFSLTHNPRPEDFPVMPVEITTVALKPNGFFTENPANDVPRSSQQFNQSTGVTSANAFAGECCRS